MGRLHWVLRVRWLLLGAVVLVVGVLLLLRGREPQDTVVVTVSRPRTVATLPAPVDWTTYCHLSWLANDTLIVSYRFEAGRVGGGVAASLPWCWVSGIARVHLPDGRGEVLRAPRPIGGSPRVVHRWSGLA
jgi:hypothetical protein